MHNRLSSIIVAAAGSLGVTSALLGDVYTFRTVAMTGDAAPATFGGVFTGFGAPSINGNGLVAFSAQTNAATVTSGMWMTPSDAPGTIGFIAGKGWPAPGTPNGVTFGDFTLVSFRAPLINEPGNVGFSAPLVGIESDQVVGLFRRIDGVVTKVAVPGEQAPGLGAGVVHKTLEFPSFNNGNLMAFRSQLEGPGVVAGQNDIAQYMHWFGGLNVVHRGGWAVPDRPGAVFGNIFSTRAQIADNGRTSFQCTVSDSGGPYKSSHWTGWPAALTLHALAGELSPAGLPYGSAYTFCGSSMSQNGVCFAMQVSGGGAYSGLWYHNGSTTQTVAYRTGAGPLGTYDAVFGESMMTAADGTTVFRARFNQPENSDSAIVRKVPNQPATVVVRENDPVYPWGTIQFDELGNNDKVMIDDNGRTYIIANVRGPGVNASNNTGMWVREADGEWHFVIRRGWNMSLEDGVFRTVDTFAVLPGYGLHSGYRPGINNRGDIAMRIDFTDGVSAIVVAELPACLGDLNHDGFVDFSDLLILISAWGACNNCEEDLNQDGTVDFQDLLVLLANWGAC